MLLRLEEWEGIIQKMIDECHHDPKMTTNILMEWRAKLEKEPTLLKPFQIDQIMRAARDRLSNVSR